MSKLLFAEVSLRQQEIITGGTTQGVPINVSVTTPVITPIINAVGVGVSIGQNNAVIIKQISQIIGF
ncbi:MAG: hypothetical protein NTY89_08695 [Nostocales cyanobacterium LacPavin_0920_SED1_MAG_38_18]|nr:hypothetical protein [Nostocales cyanobacterium LacPavin_0920_SED1_MAG_38_18]